MTTTLSEGVKVPDVGSVNWAGDLEVNWNLLNGALANLSGNVKTDRDNTWTGEQSFTLPIVGSITGTASKAIADEDGTSIKTGYVNVAGNQTVTGQKTWGALNAHTKGLWLDGAREAYIFPENAAAYSGLLFATQAFGQSFKFGDWQTSNNEVSFNYSNAYLSIDAGYYSGTSKNRVEVAPRNADESSLGSSSYQWSSVYAQTYYYNGTAWGLDQNNTWTGNNTFSSTLKQVNSTITRGTIPQSDITAFNMYWGGTGVSSLNNALFAQRGYINADGSTAYVLYAVENAIGGTDTRIGLIYDPNDTVNKRYAYLRGDFRPYSNNAFNLGTSTNQWKSVYAQSYYYNGTEFSSKFVTTDTSQSISSQKTFNANLICTSSIYTRNNDYTLGTIPTSSITATNRFVDKSNADFGYVRGVVYTDGRTVAELKTRNKFTNGALNPSGSSVESTLIVGIDSTGSSFLQFNGRLQNGLIPTASESYNCGTSTNKWKTLNGVNPGALSLPDISNFVELDKTNWYLDGTATDIIASGDGWIQVVVTGDSTSYVVLQVGYYGYPNCYYRATGTAIVDSASAMLPVKSGHGVRMFLKGTSIYIARFFPMLGNV